MHPSGWSPEELEDQGSVFAHRTSRYDALDRGRRTKHRERVPSRGRIDDDTIKARTAINHLSRVVPELAEHHHLAERGDKIDKVADDLVLEDSVVDGLKFDGQKGVLFDAIGHIHVDNMNIFEDFTHF